ncbi:uncharacterized protein LOC144879352 [Branchiostoma floridae x Branchiostoma japonicum]
MGDKRRRQKTSKKSKRGKKALLVRQALRRMRLSGLVDSGFTTRSDKQDTSASQAETQPIGQNQTSQVWTSDTGQTVSVKEEDDQEKWLDAGDNNITTPQLNCGTVANDIKEEPVDELEKSLVDCCKSNAQLLSCDPVGTDAERKDEEEMKLDNSYNTKTPSLLGCGTVGIQVEKEETNIDNCYSATSQFTDAKEKDKLEDGFEERRKEFLSSENKKSRKSDSDCLEQTECQLQLKRKKTFWVCKCKEKFASKGSYFKHKLEAHPETCEYCGEKFHTRQRLNKHLMTHLPSRDKLDLKGNKLLLCDHCGKFFTNWNMKMHKLQLSEARPYKCDVQNCKSSFREKGHPHETPFPPYPKNLAVPAEKSRRTR